ncbi:MAG: ASPIC/UnbV domain-containing protein [Candidatus Sumerlaeia bacterium]|nr:ASPIC/UnbV domain-containing protein [Candidatus Sumerlaeia bacterium]
MADFDNDMDPGAYVATWNARIGGESAGYLFFNEVEVYVDRSAQAGITLGLSTYACAVTDANGDGFLDIYAVNGDDFGTRDTLYLNNGNSNHWIEIDPRSIISNRDAIGLKAWLTAGGVTQVQELYSTTALPSLLHFGLGLNTTVEQLVLRWPRWLVETYTDLPADQVFRPVEGTVVPFPAAGMTLR